MFQGNRLESLDSRRRLADAIAHFLREMDPALLLGFVYSDGMFRILDFQIFDRAEHGGEERVRNYGADAVLRGDK